MLSWENGDEILVSDGAKSTVFKASGSGSSVEFVSEGLIISSAKTYSAVYPAAASRFEDGRVTVDVPAVSAAIPDKYPECPAVAVSDGASREMTFRNVCGLLSFDVTGKDVRSLIFEGLDGEVMAGKIAIDDFAGCSFSVLEPAASVSVEAEKAIAPGRHYAAVLPQTFGKGLKVTMVKTDGSSVSREYEPFVLGRSMYVNLDKIDEGRYIRYVINDAEQLQAFLDDAPLCESYVNAVLASDIDLKGFPLVPAASYKGTFDGDGYSLHGWESDSPLFEVLEDGGAVENLNIGMSCSFTVGKGSRLAPVAGVNRGKIASCVNNADIKGVSGDSGYLIGGIAAESYGSVENCTNKGLIDIGGTLSGAGGIVGKFHGRTGDSALSGCTNDGSVIAEGTVPAIGGIAARGSGGVIRSCRNNGEVKMEPEGPVDSLMAGGVAGILDASVENCTNAGVLSVAGNALVTVAAGGVVGRCEGEANYIHACTHEGEVYADAVCAEVNAGGVTGWCSVPVRSSTKSDGNVFVEDRAAGNLYVGGVIGQSMSTYNAVYNNGNVTVNVGADGGQVMMGGVAGYMGNSALKTNSLITGQNNGNVKLTGGVGNDSREIFYIAGVVGNTAIPNVSHSNTSWATCNTNHGTIETDVPLTVYAGGVFGRVTGAGVTANTACVSGARNDGAIIVSGPGPDSCVGGVVARHGRGRLGNANAFGQAVKPASIIVSGADESVSVGAYAGYVSTDNGGNYPACCMYLSGFSCYGSVDAGNATAGVLVGRAALTGNSTSNGIMLGSSSSERPKISASFVFNGVTIDNPASGDFSVGTFFGRIMPSATTTRIKTDGTSLKNVYYFCAGGVNGEVSYTAGLQQI
ncbi:MAG: hypothetical protein K2O58_05195, partial [Bacteroidales bacterium]|nr:hypothetical protein [Bacteroidales bacterium]